MKEIAHYSSKSICTKWRGMLAAMLAFSVLATVPFDAHADRYGNNKMTRKSRNAVIGAGIGAAGGALLSDGDIWTTVGAGAAGGVLGYAVTKDDHDDWRRDSRRHYREKRRYKNNYHRR